MKQKEDTNQESSSYQLPDTLSSTPPDEREKISKLYDAHLSKLHEDHPIFGEIYRIRQSGVSAILHAFCEAEDKLKLSEQELANEREKRKEAERTISKMENFLLDVLGQFGDTFPEVEKFLCSLHKMCTDETGELKYVQ